MKKRDKEGGHIEHMRRAGLRGTEMDRGKKTTSECRLFGPGESGDQAELGEDPRQTS